jgi:hypothetical protein
MNLIMAFKTLPQDLQLYIGYFLPIWQRFGLTSPPKYPEDDRKKYSYYTNIRHKPRFRGIKWDPNFPRYFDYRIQKDYFQWQLILDYYNHQYHPDDIITDHYLIKCHHQWKSDSKNMLEKIFNKGFYKNINMPDIAVYIRAYIAPGNIYNDTYPVFKLELRVTRTDFGIPTRQMAVNVLSEYMIQLSREAEITRKDLMKEDD